MYQCIHGSFDPDTCRSCQRNKKRSQYLLGAAIVTALSKVGQDESGAHLVVQRTQK